jgi:hypothetical protein
MPTRLMDFHGRKEPGSGGERRRKGGRVKNDSGTSSFVRVRITPAQLVHGPQPPGRRIDRWASASRSRSESASQSRPRVHRMSQQLCGSPPPRQYTHTWPADVPCALPVLSQGLDVLWGRDGPSRSDHPPRTPRLVACTVVLGPMALIRIGRLPLRSFRPTSTPSGYRQPSCP